MAKALTQEIFISRSTEIHSGKYMYDNVKFTDTKTKVSIICPLHGEFLQVPNKHLAGNGCPKCGRLSIKYKNSGTKDNFITNARLVHGDKYDYSKVVYVNSTSKVCIICPTHGEFMQTPNGHLNGNGCSKCRNSRGESAIRNYLLSHSISFQSEYRNSDCVDRKMLPFDFAVFTNQSKTDIKFLIEYDGIQHYTGVSSFGGEQNHARITKHDKIKTLYCTNNNIPLIRLPYYTFDNITNILDKLFSEEYTIQNVMNYIKDLDPNRACFWMEGGSGI